MDGGGGLLPTPSFSVNQNNVIINNHGRIVNCKRGKRNDNLKQNADTKGYLRKDDTVKL